MPVPMMPNRATNASRNLQTETVPDLPVLAVALAIWAISAMAPPVATVLVVFNLVAAVC